MVKALPQDVAEPLTLSVEDACRLLSVGRTTFYKLIKSGKIVGRKCGRRTIVLRSELEQALKCLPLAGRIE